LTAFKKSFWFRVFSASISFAFIIVAPALVGRCNLICVLGLSHAPVLPTFVFYFIF